MIIGLILGIISWFIFKSIIISLIVFYVVTGIRKSSLWLGIPIERRNVFLPPVLKPLNICSFIIGALFWPVFIIGGDPLHDYFESINGQHFNVKNQTKNRKPIIIENKSLKDITDYIKESIGLTPEFMWEWDNYEPNEFKSNEDIIIENERVNYLLNFFNDGHWYKEYKFDVTEDDIYNEQNPINKEILNKKLEIEKAVNRDIKLKYLICVYERYYGELLSNPKRFIKNKDDDLLIDIFYKCDIREPGRLLGLGYFHFSEIEYNKYFK